MFSQMAFHIGAIASLAIGVIYDPLSRIGGGLFAIAYALIFKDVLLAALRYRRANKKLAAQI
jgi:hypothetical protein